MFNYNDDNEEDLDQTKNPERNSFNDSSRLNLIPVVTTLGIGR